jgi:2-amino-4-hydroxy-6-hydroxymethyldihydropteridine diphosphokinase
MNRGAGAAVAREPGATVAVLALGSNLGDRAGYLGSAVRWLGDAVLAVSPVYETQPWGDPDQPPYLNAVVIATGGDGPRYWLGVARAIESAAGRHRDPDRPLGPRTLDVDVISVASGHGEPVTSDDPELILPHPRAHLRAFVLRPWLDVRAEAVLPGHGRVFDLLLTDPVASDLVTLRPRDDVVLETMM